MKIIVTLINSNTSNNSWIMVLAIVIIARIVMMSASDNKNHNCHKLRVVVAKYQLSKNISNSHNNSHSNNNNRILWSWAHLGATLKRLFWLGRGPQSLDHVGFTAGALAIPEHPLPRGRLWAFRGSGLSWAAAPLPPESLSRALHKEMHVEPSSPLNCGIGRSQRRQDIWRMIWVIVETPSILVSPVITPIVLPCISPLSGV